MAKEKQITIYDIASKLNISLYGLFTYKGIILNPIAGWTSHHSILDVNGKWYLFYHDSSLSKGITHLRSVKVTGLKYNDGGTIQITTSYEDN